MRVQHYPLTGTPNPAVPTAGRSTRRRRAASSAPAGDAVPAESSQLNRRRQRPRSDPSRRPSVPEGDYQQTIIDLLRLNGWKVYHTHDSRRSEPGFPDLIAIKGGDLLALEIKSDRGRPTPAQLEWLEAFARVERVTSKLIYPKDWDVVLTTASAPVTDANETSILPAESMR